MRICLITHSDSPWTAVYSRHLLRAGHALSLITFHPKKVEGVDFHYVGVKQADGRLPKWLYLWRIPRVRAILRRLDPDVVLATYLHSNGLIGALTKRCALVVSSVGADHHWGLAPFLSRSIAGWIGSRAEMVHAASPELMESLISAGIQPHKLVVIPLGTDAAVFFPRAEPRVAGPLRIICTRKHLPLYDNDTIIRALALLRDQGVEFECRFVGAGRTLEQTRTLSQSLGLSSGVEFVGGVEHSRVAGLLRWADIYVSAAKSDGSPSSLFEAMSCKLFPVVTDVRANRDWLKHKVTGYLCPVGDEREFARGIRFGWETPAVAARAGEINRRNVIERCDLATGLARLEGVLERAVELYRG